MQLTEPANRDGIAQDSCAASGTQASERIGLEMHCALIGAEREQALDISLHIVEIDGLAGTPPLLRRARAAGDARDGLDLAQALARDLELFADFKEPYAALLPAQVLAARGD